MAPADGAVPGAGRAAPEVGDRGGQEVAPLRPRHLDAVRAIETVGFDDPWSEASWRDELARDDRRWRVLLDGGVPVGFAGLWLALDEAHVLRVAVHPERRGRGGGRRLVTELLAVAVALGRRAVTLEVRASGAAASLYRRLGFVSHGRRPGYYADGEDALVLWWEAGQVGRSPSADGR